MPSAKSNRAKYWVRAERLRVSNSAWRVFVPLVDRHFVSLGIASQAELLGDGTEDFFVEFPPSDGSHWSYDFAVDLCIRSLSEINRLSEGELNRCNLLAVLDTLTEYQVARIVSLPPVKDGEPPSHMTELVVQNDVLFEVLEDAKSDPASFIIMKEFGILCVEKNLMAHQPPEFRQWFNSVLVGGVNTPGKAPQNWKLIPRNSKIYWLARTMECHGFTVTRNDTSAPNSACDILAAAGKQLKLRGAMSYTNVRRIYKHAKDVIEVLPAVKLRE